MPALHRLTDAAGRVLSVGPDGRLLLAGRDDRGGVAVVLAGPSRADDPVWAGLALLGAPGGARLRIGAADPRDIVGCRVTEAGAGCLALRFEPGGVLVDNGKGLSLGEVAEAALRLRPVPCAASGAGIFASLPEAVELDFSGLAFVFASGDPRHLPMLDAWLSLLPIDRIRLAWGATVAHRRRDVFFDLVRAHGRARMGGFGSFTADSLRAGIEAHGWSIGEGTYGLPRILEPGRGMLRIGRYCSMAEPTIVLGNHAIRSASSYPFVDLWKEWPGATAQMSDHVSGDVTIGNDVWIGVDVTILPHARIGDGAVIGAGCVVRGEIPPYAICTGNPATVRRMRFPPATVERLLRLRWWDWPPARIDRCLGLLCDERIDAFLNAAEAEDADRPSTAPH